MKVNSIEVDQYLGLSSALLTLDAKVTVIAGANGVGKSSLVHAVRHALAGELNRVSLKKDADQLVRTGAKRARVRLSTTMGDYSVAVPGTAKRPETELSPAAVAALPMCLDPILVLATLPDDMRALLRRVTSTTVSPESIAGRLSARGFDRLRIDRIMPALRKGFDSARIAAQEATSEARGAWKAVTGEAYGKDKAEGWTCPEGVDVGRELDEADNALTAARNAEAQWHTRNGEALARASALAQEDARRSALRQQAASYSNDKAEAIKLQAEVDVLETRVAELQQQCNSGPAGTRYQCPACKSDLMLDKDVLFEHTPRAVDPADLVALDEAVELQIATRSRLNAVVQRLKVSEPAHLAVESFTDMESSPTVDAAELTALETATREAEARRDKLREVKRHKETAARKTAEAAAHHKEVGAWTDIAEALAPDGIPGELMRGMLNPVRERLMKSATELGWPLVYVQDDMRLLIGGRGVHLCSESERYRAAVMFGEAMAFISGLNLLVLDAADILQPSARMELIDWLAKSPMETVIVTMTLGKAPGELGESIQSYWIADGTVTGQNERIAA